MQARCLLNAWLFLWLVQVIDECFVGLLSVINVIMSRDTTVASENCSALSLLQTHKILFTQIWKALVSNEQVLRVLTPLLDQTKPHLLCGASDQQCQKNIWVAKYGDRTNNPSHDSWLFSHFYLSQLLAMIISIWALGSINHQLWCSSSVSIKWPASICYNQFHI